MTWANHITIFAHGILVTPLIIIMFSKDEISVWYLLQTLMGLGMLADAGFGYTLSRAVAFFFAGATSLPKNHREYNQNLEHQDHINFDKLNKLLSTANRIYIIISLILIGIIVPVGIAVMWNVMTITGHNLFLWLAFGVTMATNYVILQKVKWSAFMTGTQRVGELYRFHTFVGLIKIVGFSLILTLHPDIFLLSIYMFVECAIENLYIRHKVNKWFTDNNIKRKNLLYFDKEIFNSLWSATWRLGLTTWGNYFTVYGTSLIISQVKDTTLIANFLFTQKILTFGQRIAEAPFYANVPRIYGLMARKNNQQSKHEISKQIFLTIGMLCLGFAFIGIMGNSILSFLDVDIRFVQGMIYFILALSIFLDSHSTIQGTVYISTNHVPFMIPSLVSGFFMIVIGFWALPLYGLLGVVITRFLIGLCVDNWYSTYLSLRLLKWPFKTYLADISIKGFLYWKQKIKSMGIKSDQD